MVSTELHTFGFQAEFMSGSDPGFSCGILSYPVPIFWGGGGCQNSIVRSTFEPEIFLGCVQRIATSNL